MLVYAIVKFAAYAAWCLLGLRLLAPGRATLPSALRFGSVRWLLGLAFGLIAGIALGSISSESVLPLYLSVYTPLRVIEWGIMAILIGRSSTSSGALLRSPRVWIWIIGGILVSFLSDLASPEGLAGKFCVGRCLC